MVAWRLEISLLMLKTIFHSFPALSQEIFFNTQREILYLHAVMQYPLLTFEPLILHFPVHNLHLKILSNLNRR